MLLVALGAMLGMGGMVEVRRHRSALAQADREMAAGRYGAARQRLIGLSTRWMGPDEVDLWLQKVAPADDGSQGSLPFYELMVRDNVGTSTLVRSTRDQTITG